MGKYTDQFHRLHTLPQHRSAMGTWVCFADLFRSAASPMQCAKALIALRRYKVQRPDITVTSIRVLDLVPTQEGAFIHKIEDDIRKEKFSKPILVWRTQMRRPECENASWVYYILDGHHRVAGAVLMGTEELPAIIITDPL